MSNKIYFEEIILVGLGAIQIICAIQEGHYIQRRTRYLYLYNHFGILTYNIVQVSETCLPGSSSPSKRALLGYALDGFPVYGFSQNTAGETLKSCWKTTLSSPTMVTDFTYDTAGYAAGTCHLDQANGYTFSDGYGYVTTAEPYYVPYKYSGTSWAKICGFSP